MIRNALLYATLLVLVPFAASADSEQDDKLCEVIGEAPNVSVPPKDRLWFKENCACAGSAGCGAPGSKRFSERLKIAKKRLEERAAAERIVQERRKAAAKKVRALEAKAAEEERRAAERERLEWEERDKKLTQKRDQIRATCRAYASCRRADLTAECVTEREAYQAACSRLTSGEGFWPCEPMFFEDRDSSCGALAEETEQVEHAARTRAETHALITASCKSYRSCRGGPAAPECATERAAFTAACSRLTGADNFYPCDEFWFDSPENNCGAE